MRGPAQKALKQQRRRAGAARRAAITKADNKTTTTRDCMTAALARRPQHAPSGNKNKKQKPSSRRTTSLSFSASSSSRGKILMATTRSLVDTPCTQRQMRASSSVFVAKNNQPCKQCRRSPWQCARSNRTASADRRRPASRATMIWAFSDFSQDRHAQHARHVVATTIETQTGHSVSENGCGGRGGKNSCYFLL